MVSRREVLTGGLAAGVSGIFNHNDGTVAAAPQPRTKVSFNVPPGGCDCHVHVFGDPARYPFWAGRSYTPEPATVEELGRLLQALHLDRVVIVQPSVYGTDNSCTLDSIRGLGKRARGVVVIDDKTTEASLDEMHRAGARGIRLNFSTLGITDPAAARQRLQAGVERVRNRSWHIQINTQPGTIEALREELMALPVTLVIDHFGGATAARGIEQPGFGTLVNLVKAGKAYVKISGSADLVSTQPDLSDVAPFARALVAANPRRILWGTNWPHPGSASVPGRKPTALARHVPTDDGKVLNMLPVWVPDAATRRMILVENPARLYGF
jgi:predicted TIM-barrel fold metal-dependent hydrolase